ncbi:MAG TPA: LacI family DNA-binding transcriptional regulator [Actinocatenispora sp.]
MTIREVAQAAGVSIATVSRALNGESRVSAATRARVTAAAERLGYLPNELARSLHAGSTRTIGLVVPDLTNPFFPELVQAAVALADERGHLVLLCPTADDRDTAYRTAVALRRKQVDGVILIGDRIGGARLAEVLRGLPVVTVDREAHVPGADVILSAHREGGRLAVRHLVECGHRHIAHLAGPDTLRVSRDRLAGYSDALAEAGLPEVVLAGDGLDEADGYRLTGELLARHPECTAVFAANDMMAVGALSALRAKGFDVPGDISVVGFDDIHLAGYLRPTLTTVRQDTALLGRRAAAALLDRIGTDAPPIREVVPVELFVRESTAPPKNTGGPDAP